MVLNLKPLVLKKEKRVFLEDVIWGLSQNQKQLNCKYFYDERGSKLFDDICNLEEYYPTRTEIALLNLYGKEIADYIGSDICLIEYGCGSLLKTKILIDALEKPRLFIPIDISEEHLLKSAENLSTKCKGLKILPHVADFTQTMDLPKQIYTEDNRCVGFFPGSTIGNFNHDDAISFLKGVAKTVGRGGGLLIGVDTKKDTKTLINAYDDKAGVTAAFNLNIIKRINHELGGNFDVAAFNHKVVYNKFEGRIELYLESLKKQMVQIQNFEFSFNKGETIHTENSYKYYTEEFTSLAKNAGFFSVKTWVDENQLFSLHYLKN